MNITVDAIEWYKVEYIKYDPISGMIPEVIDQMISLSTTLGKPVVSGINGERIKVYPDSKKDDILQTFHNLINSSKVYRDNEMNRLIEFSKERSLGAK